MINRKIVCFFLNFLFGSQKKEEKNKQINLDKIKKILIIKLNSIGDVLMTTPFIREIRKKLPNTQINYLISNLAKEILVNNSNINRIIDIDTKKIYKNNFSKFYQLLRLSKKIKRENYDLCFVFEPHYLAQLFVQFCRIPIKIGLDRDGEGFSLTHKIDYLGEKHEILSYLETLRFLGVKSKNVKMEIFLSDKDKKFAKKFLKKNRLKNKKIIGIVPGGAKNIKEMSIKRWQAEKYTKLCNELIKKDYTIIFFGNSSDIKIIDKIIKKLNNKNYFNLAGKTSIKESAALIKECKLFITHDSGLMHIASAVKTLTIAIFGPTPPVRFAPLNNNSVYIWKESLSCTPCYDIYGKFPNCKTHKCMKEITIKEVLLKVNKLLKIN